VGEGRGVAVQAVVLGLLADAHAVGWAVDAGALLNAAVHRRGWSDADVRRERGGTVELAGLMLLGLFAFSWFGVLLGMHVRSPDAMLGFGNALVFPLACLAGTFVPIEGMQAIAEPSASGTRSRPSWPPSGTRARAPSPTDRGRSNTPSWP
jgi:hypothetical protein